MVPRFPLFIFLLLLVPLSNIAQKITVSGHVLDSQSGEFLINANVFTGESILIGTSTNSFGFYSLTVPKGSVTIQASYVGYGKFRKTINISRDTTVDIKIDAVISLNEVSVIGHKSGERASISEFRITPIMIRFLPTLGGERDIIRSLQLLPGIQSATEATTGLVVRGGSPDQNLFLLDGNPIYNISHLYGFLSVFNDDAINSVDVIKGGFPARYGGRLSSIIDVRMKEGNLYKHEGSASIGLISSRISLNGPVIKGKGSYMFSARRSYFDLITAIPDLLRNTKLYKQNSGYSLYDLNGKINFILSPSDRIYLNLYNGNDSYSESYMQNDYSVPAINKSKNSLKWGNSLASLQWNHTFSNKLFCNTQLSFTHYHLNSEYEYLSEAGQGNTLVKSGIKSVYSSIVRDITGKADFNYYPGENHKINFGVEAIGYKFSPGVQSYLFTGDSLSRDTLINAVPFNSFSSSVYAEDQIRLPNGIFLNPGLRFNLYRSGNTNYWSLEPRFSGGYEWPGSAKIELSYSRIQQSIHLLSNSGLGMPTDLWVPSTERIPPQQSQQFSAGFGRPFGPYHFGIEAYYKDYRNLISYAEGASFLVQGNDWQNKIVTGGVGKAYGLEFLLRREEGKLKGWLAYTLSWSQRKFDQINGGRWYFDRYDRRHDIALNLTYEIKENIVLSGTWVFTSGNPVTLPETIYPYVKYPVGMNDFNYGELMSSQNMFGFITEMSRRRGEIIYYGERNKYRMPAYHRLDLGISFIKEKKHFQRTWSLGLYNAYSHLNPFYVTYTDDTSGAWAQKSSAGLKIVTLLPIMPSVSYSIKF